MAGTITDVLRNKGNAVYSVSPGATVYEAIELMADKSVGALVVVWNEALVGIISERDYARKVILQGKSSKETHVEEVMTPSPFAVTPGHTVEQCMQLMTERRIRHLPVLDGERLAGMISIGDLVKAIISEQAETIEHLHTYIVAKYPA
jgi:CBS domain-containing protein